MHPHEGIISWFSDLNIFSRLVMAQRRLYVHKPRSLVNVPFIFHCEQKWKKWNPRFFTVKKMKLGFDECFVFVDISSFTVKLLFFHFFHFFHFCCSSWFGRLGNCVCMLWKWISSHQCAPSLTVTSSWRSNSKSFLGPCTGPCGRAGAHFYEIAWSCIDAIEARHNPHSLTHKSPTVVTFQYLTRLEKV